VVTRVRSTRVIISEIPQLLSMLIVLSTDWTTYRRLPNDSWLHLTTSNIDNRVILIHVEFRIMNHESWIMNHESWIMNHESWIMNLESWISEWSRPMFESLFKKTQDVVWSILWGANALYRLIQSDIHLKLHIAKQSDCKAIFL
jgi:hypothetical protein